MFSSEKIESKVLQILEEWLPADKEISHHTNLKFDLGLGEMETAELALKINDEVLPYYDLTEGDYLDLENLTTVEDLLEWVEGLQDLHWKPSE